ncbi:Spy0128 family protein [Ileibacterium valens]|uniref:VWFA domain-containing protein n=3 Tax=Ileibacterium valens TaxID=1862668 RepID=A0A1U7NHA9_9FIRM|nr:FctA domain-containing protein [Ileibacterium valens]OLU40369.1 hypothetical protein BO224_05785 [Erysipelotrichaceae bacterium NYU-BL-E8]OLU40394.1 hypothetical protein BM735_05640 [Erysipelotrichaceae bacterium NYU-BL-F16]OLU40986.1 hypothetical protein BO222_04065 [Ileibacterium valens]
MNLFSKKTCKTDSKRVLYSMASEERFFAESKTKNRFSAAISKVLSFALAASMVLQNGAGAVVLAKDTDPVSNSRAVSSAKVSDPTTALTTSENEIGRVLSQKNVSASDDGFNVSLSAISSTSDETTRSTTPLDIVLVLDRSGSMAHNFAGGSFTSDSNPSRMTGLKTAVSNFVKEAKTRNDQITDSSKKIRIGVVSYASESTVNSQLTYNLDHVNSVVQSLRASGATRTDYGMNNANSVMGYSRAEASKVVIFFTDGVPTTQSSFNATVATDTISYAKKLKDSGASVYSIGIFNDANPSLNPNSIGTGSRVSESEKANRFMQMVSSNCPSASAFDDSSVSYEPKGFYLAASNSGGLNEVFNNIFSSITSEPVHPLETAQGTEGVTFIDELGDGMEVINVTSLNYADKAYKPTKNADGSYSFNAEVDGNIMAEGKQNLSAIQVRIVKGINLEGDTIEYSVPANLLPLVKYHKSEDGKMSIEKEALPITLNYTAAPKSAIQKILSGDNTEYSVEAAKFITDHSKDGKLVLYSNKYSSGENGTTTASFTPNADNVFYYPDAGTRNPNLPTNAKDQNPTETAANRSASVWSGNAVTTYLGNNGKLVYSDVLGDLKISKTVQVPEGFTLDQNKEFEFPIELNYPDSAKTPVNGTFDAKVNDRDSRLTFTEGKATVRLKHGEAITLSKLPLLATYKVTETKADGYKTYVNGASGQESNTASGSISGQSPEANFFNVYSVQDLTVKPVDLKFVGTKTLRGRNWLDTDEFKFTLTGETPAAPMPAEDKRSDTVKGSEADKTFEFGSVTFNKPGTYIYLIREETVEIPGISTDTTQYQVKVVVSDNGNGILSARSTLKKKGAGDADFADAKAVEFNNEFNAQETSFAPQFKKVLTSNQAELSLESDEFNGKFEFEINAVTPNAPMPAETKAVNNGSTVQFGNITYTAQDVGNVYEYKVSEVSGNLPGVVYSTTEFDLKVTVSSELDASGASVVKIDVATYLDGKEVTDHINDAVFTNTMDVTPVTLDTNTGINLTKIMTGKDIEDGEFSFTLTPVNETVQAVQNGAVVIPDGKDQISVPAATLADGKAVSSAIFEGITFNKAGTYRFMIKENIPSSKNPGIQYDETARYVNVVVNRNGAALNAAVQYDQPGSNAAAFTNVYTAKATAPVVVKTVKDLEIGNFKDPEALYTFTVTGPDGSTKTVSHSAGESFEVLNQTYNAPGEYLYTVHEEPVASTSDGQYLDTGSMTFDTSVFQIKVSVTDNGQGQLIASTQIFKAEKAGDPFEPLKANEKFAFRNKYQPLPVTTNNQSTPTAYKLLTGRSEPLKAGEFTFNVEFIAEPTHTALSDDAGAEYTGSATTTNDASGNLNLAPIRFTRPGTYTLKVTEVAGDSDQTGITYDPLTKVWVYTVTDNNGKLEVSYTQPENGDLYFHNSYKGTGTFEFAKNGLNIQKTFTGRPNDEWLEGDSFDFELSPANEKTQQAVDEGTVVLPETTITATAMDKSPAFGDLSFTRPGTYVFNVKEKAGSLEGVTYDQTSYEVTIKVTDNNDGTLSAALAAPVELKFANTYKAGQATLETDTEFTVSKEVIGKAWADEVFNFNLVLVEGDASAVTINTPKLSLDANNPSGSFDSILFNAPGTYVFEISEEKGDSPAGGTIHFDDHKVRVTVTVTDDTYGKLIVAQTLVENDEKFINEFTANPADALISGTKVLDGRDWLENDQFIFDLKDEAGNVIQTKTAAKDHTQISFDPISYSEAGTYKYTVVERAGQEGNGVSYDQSVKNVTVVVTQDDATGALSAAVEGNDFTFTNTYNAQPVSGLAELNASKNVVSENTPYNMSEGAFEFTVTPDENNPENDPYGETRTVSNAADGSVDLFAAGEFILPGTYRYTVSENDNRIPGMTYDGSVYTVAVTVTDNNAGNLEKSILIQKDGNDVNEIAFSNTYNPDKATALIQAKKELSGKELVNGMFSFNLSFTGMTPVEENTADKSVMPAPETPESPEPSVNGTNPADPPTDATVDGNPDDSVNEGVTPDLPLEPEAPQTPAVDENQNAVGELQGTEEAEETAPLTPANQIDPAQVLNAEGNSDSDENGQIMLLNNEEETPVVSEETPVRPEETPADNQENTLPAENNETETTETDDPTQEADDANTESEDSSEVNIPASIDAVNEGSIVSFGSIEFSKPGDYHFVMKEINDGKPGITYDSNEYEVTVSVRHDQENGKLVVTNIAGAGTDLQTFKNSYTPAAVSVTSAQIKASKILEGRDLRDGEFTFELKDNDGNTAATGVNDASGNIVFTPVEGALTFTKPGTYAYVMSEVKGEAGGVTYDSRTYGVAITVIDENAQLAATVDIEGEEGTAVFTNHYKADQPATVTPSIIKRLVGATIKDGQFKFTISQDGKVIGKPKTNDASGKVLFDELTFDKPGTYVYQIEEVKEDTKKYDYDQKVLTLTVVVTDSNEGYLNADASYDGEAVFTNTVKSTEPGPAPTPQNPEPDHKGDKTPAEKLKDAPTAVKTGLSISLMTIVASLSGIIAILIRRRQLSK